MAFDTGYFKKKLEEELGLLQKELGEIAIRNPKNQSDWNAHEEEHQEKSDLNAAADIHEDMRERHAISDELEKRLSSVSLALKKIKDGTYGICEMCKKKIEEGRLVANSSARTCKKHLNNELS